MEIELDMKQKIIKTEQKFDTKVVKNHTGQVIKEKTYKSGKLHGPINLYWDNGSPRLQGKFNDNVRIGNWKHYDNEGKLILEEEF